MRIICAFRDRRIYCYAIRAWFKLRILNKGNRNTKVNLRPLLEYGPACCDPCREGQINALDRVQTKAAQFADHTKDSDWKRWFSLGR